MSRLFQVKQSNDEEFDVEGFEDADDTHSSPSPPPPSIFSAAGDDVDVNNNVKTTDDDDDGSTSFASNRAYFVNKKTVIAAFSTVLVISVAVSVAVGLPINGAAGHNQEFQKSFAAALDGKAAKSSFCEPEPEQVLTCGQTFTDEKVVLSDDLFCTDEVGGAPTGVLKSLNAAIKIEGPDAVIDCKGHTISQRSSKNAAFCDKKIVTRDEREDMKTECDLFYVYGIWLVDGATAINCKVEHFYYGIQITDGGEVKKKKSEVSGNRVGVSIRDNSSSTTKISDL